MRRLTPLLRGIREEARQGAYTLVLEFETKEQMTLDMWESRVGKIQSFFGPGVTAEVQALFGTSPPASHGSPVDLHWLLGSCSAPAQKGVVPEQWVQEERDHVRARQTLWSCTAATGVLGAGDSPENAWGCVHRLQCCGVSHALSALCMAGGPRGGRGGCGAEDGRHRHWPGRRRAEGRAAAAHARPQGPAAVSTPWRTRLTRASARADLPVQQGAWRMRGRPDV